MEYTTTFVWITVTVSKKDSSNSHFRNYFIGIHIFTLVSPLDDEENHILYTKQPKFKWPAVINMSLHKFWTRPLQ